jgi:hypothetical protein
MPQERRGPVLCFLLDQAKANLARDAAHLENGRINLGRYVPLAKQGAATQHEASTQQAKVVQEQTVIKADQAAIEYAKTELSYTKLVAPFDAVAGIGLLDIGNIIHSSMARGSSTKPSALARLRPVGSAPLPLKNEKICIGAAAMENACELDRVVCHDLPKLRIWRHARRPFRSRLR